MNENKKISNYKSKIKKLENQDVFYFITGIISAFACFYSLALAFVYFDYFFLSLSFFFFFALIFKLFYSHHKKINRAIEKNRNKFYSYLTEIQPDSDLRAKILRIQESLTEKKEQLEKYEKKNKWGHGIVFTSTFFLIAFLGYQLGKIWRIPTFLNLSIALILGFGVLMVSFSWLKLEPQEKKIEKEIEQLEKQLEKIVKKYERRT